MKWEVCLLCLQLTEVSLFINSRRCNDGSCRAGGTFNPFNLTPMVRRLASSPPQLINNSKLQLSFLVFAPLRALPARWKTLWAVRLGRYQRGKEQAAWQKDGFTPTAAWTSPGISQATALNERWVSNAWRVLVGLKTRFLCWFSGSQVPGAEERRQHRRLRRHPAWESFSRADLPSCGPVQQVSGRRLREE